MLHVDDKSDLTEALDNTRSSDAPHYGEFLAQKTRNFTFAGLAIVAVTFGLARYGFGLFVPDISRDLSLSSDIIGLIAGSSYIGYLCATLTAAWISRKFGPRLPIVFGGLAACLGMLMVGFADSGATLLLAIFVAFVLIAVFWVTCCASRSAISSVF